MSKTPYWKSRRIQLNRALEKDEAALNRRLTSIYRTEEQSLARQIASYYTQYGENNVIEYRQLLQRLSESDYQLLMQHMDDFAKQHPEYAHLLPVRESIYKLNRMEGLQYSVQMQQLELGIKERSEVEAHLQQLGQREFMAVQQDLGAGQIFNSENARMIQDIVRTPWTQGKNFSDRIWDNRSKLTRTLNNEIASGFARGDNYGKLTTILRQKFDVSRREAQRLIYTEGTFVQNETRAQAVQNVFEYYSVETVNDSKVCDICQDAQDRTQAEPVRFVDRMEGENFPPFHPWCRCSYIIVVPDEQAWIDNYVNSHGGDPVLDDEARKQAQDVLDRFTGDATAEDVAKKVINSAADCEDFDALKTYFSNTYGVPISESVRQLHFESVKSSCRGIEAVMKEFPSAQKTLTSIGTENSGVMCAKYSGEICFNPKHYDDPAHLKGVIMGDTTGFHPKNTGLIETGSHEMGHLLERTLIQQKLDDGSVYFGGIEWNKCRQAQDVVSTACKQAKKTPEGKGKKNFQLKSEVSGYALQNASECLAECVADHVANGDNASILSRLVWDILKERLQ